MGIGSTSVDTPTGGGVVMSETPEQLADRIRLGEDSSLELKEVTVSRGRITGPRRDQLADELAAFANASGGTLVLGVEDRTRRVTGISLPQLDSAERFVADITQDSITPPLVADISKLELPDADATPVAVLRIDIPRGMVVHKSPGGYLRRIGSSKRQMEPDCLARLFELRSRSRMRDFGTQVIANASVDDLDPRLVDRFRGEISDDARATALLRLDMVAEDEAGIPRPTVAGVLLGTVSRSAGCRRRSFRRRRTAEPASPRPSTSRTISSMPRIWMARSTIRSPMPAGSSPATSGSRPPSR